MQSDLSHQCISLALVVLSNHISLILNHLTSIIVIIQTSRSRVILVVIAIVVDFAQGISVLQRSSYARLLGFIVVLI